MVALELKRPKVTFLKYYTHPKQFLDSLKEQFFEHGPKKAQASSIGLVKIKPQSPFVEIWPYFFFRYVEMISQALITINKKKMQEKKLLKVKKCKKGNTLSCTSSSFIAVFYQNKIDKSTSETYFFVTISLRNFDVIQQYSKNYIDFGSFFINNVTRW